MSIFVPLDKMTEGELRSRFDWHISFSSMYRSKNENSMAKEFYHLAMVYGGEMDRRGISFVESLPKLPKLGKIPTDPNSEGWDDPDR